MWPLIMWQECNVPGPIEASKGEKKEEEKEMFNVKLFFVQPRAVGWIG